jgi:alpha-glucosidase (family GH31 glycosyl hydrolase)
MKLHRTDRRPMIFHRWGGLGSHRYPIGFSGDTYSTFGSLAFQPYFTATASNVCFGYWGHDLGGHLQIAPTNEELMLRWLQFGVFSPIFRTHGASQEGNERRIWKFGNFEKLLKCVNLRYELMPYIYTAARQAYDTGISICRPLYYEWPEENEAYRQEGEYMFGDNILVSPIVTTSNGDSRTFHKTWLPEGRWYDVCRNRLLDGGQTLSEYYADDEIPYFIKAGSIVVCNPQMNNLKTTSDKLLIKVIPGDDGSTDLYEDAGDTQDYMNGGFTTTHIAQQRTASGISIDARNGSYEGMPTERAYEMHLLLANKPERVTINGVETSDWSYDAARHLVVVNIATTPCEQQVVVNVEYGVSGITNVTTVEVVAERYYDLSGRPCAEKPHGAYIVCRTWSDGSVTTQKEF